MINAGLVSTLVAAKGAHVILKKYYLPWDMHVVTLLSTIDGWNAWFFSDLEKLFSVWPGANRNQMSVGELWLGFLKFYAGEFDDARLVVSTRMGRQLSKFEKMWNSPCIAIEDPFDLNHNLGAGISRKSKSVEKLGWNCRIFLLMLFFP